MPHAIDPQSPVPLYHQIAESIRAAIASGSLRPGEALTPLRQAAEHWGVNVHTVRHAYTALAREGLLKTHRGAQGTRVVGGGQLVRLPPKPGTSLATFLESITDEAERRYGLTPTALVNLLQRPRGKADRNVYVVECSRWQAESHAHELSSQYDVDAVPWPLQDGEPPEGVVLATYFHYNDVRKSWPRRLSSVHFASIHPDPLLRDVFADATSVCVCEMDQDTVDAVAADLIALFEPGRPEVRTRVAENPNALVPDRRGRADPHLFAPRAWAELTDDVRAHPNVFELRYILDQRDLQALADREGWPSRSHANAREHS